LFFHRPCSWQLSIHKALAAAQYERKLSVINRLGTKLYSFRSFADPLEGGALVALGLNHQRKDFALSVDGESKIRHTGIDFQVDIVKMPDGIWKTGGR
jgi:hypothetical protein